MPHYCDILIFLANKFILKPPKKNDRHLFQLIKFYWSMDPASNPNNKIFTNDTFF